MAVVVFALAALFVCALAGFTAWSAMIALRLGKFTNRNGIEVSRRENPIGSLAAILFLGLWISYQLVRPDHA
jgi:hypothetical protein